MEVAGRTNNPHGTYMMCRGENLFYVIDLDDDDTEVLVLLLCPGLGNMPVGGKEDIEPWRSRGKLPCLCRVVVVVDDIFLGIILAVRPGGRVIVVEEYEALGAADDELEVYFLPVALAF